jgi:hypothetical protein
MSLPRDLLNEIEIELAAQRRTFTRDLTRTAALEDLYRLALAATNELGRPITVFDFIRSAATDAERARRIGLVRQMRSEARELGDVP